MHDSGWVGLASGSGTPALNTKEARLALKAGLAAPGAEYSLGSSAECFTRSYLSSSTSRCESAHQRDETPAAPRCAATYPEPHCSQGAGC